MKKLLLILMIALNSCGEDTISPEKAAILAQEKQEIIDAGGINDGSFVDNLRDNDLMTSVVLQGNQGQEILYNVQLKLLEDTERYEQVLGDQIVAIGEGNGTSLIFEVMGIFITDGSFGVTMRSDDKTYTREIRYDFYKNEILGDL